MIVASLICLTSTGFAGSNTSSTASGAADAATSPTISSGAAAVKPRASAPEHCPDHRAGLWFYFKRANHWTELTGEPRLSLRVTVGRTSCGLTRQLAKNWRSRAQQARREHKAYIARITLHDFTVTAGSNAWLRAIEEAQRPYPGTRDWLRSCSSPRSEGGWGRWVPNTQGSGAGGWLQFMESTFWRMYGAARAEVTGDGYRVPASSVSWYSPLGQALAGAWAVEHGATGEWSGAGC